MKAVHFGAGNIGRGFVGLLLHEAGYEVVFADVNAELIDALAAADSYDVHLVGDGSETKTVTGFRAINSATDEEALVAEIATADVVTTAVGPRILRFVAPVIARGLAARDDDAPRLAVMACENAIGATDLLAAELMDGLPDDDTRDELASRAVFANTAVDRIVPAQAPDAGIDVTVETFFEWVVDRSPFNGTAPDIPGAHFVDSLGPYIERKLFTVNTGHATVAYTGFLAGATTISEAIGIPSVLEAAEAALAETSAALSAKHGLEGLSKVIALEGADKGVTSNTVSPGYVRTPLVDGQIADQARRHGVSAEHVVNDVLLARTPVKRLIAPEEVANLVAFICGPGTESVTGNSYLLDGGWTAS